MRYVPFVVHLFESDTWIINLLVPPIISRTSAQFASLTVRLANHRKISNEEIIVRTKQKCWAMCLVGWSKRSCASFPNILREHWFHDYFTHTCTIGLGTHCKHWKIAKILPFVQWLKIVMICSEIVFHHFMRTDDFLSLVFVLYLVFGDTMFTEKQVACSCAKQWPCDQWCCVYCYLILYLHLCVYTLCTTVESENHWPMKGFLHEH